MTVERAWLGGAKGLAVLFFLGCEVLAPGPELDFPPRPDDAPEGAEVADDLRALSPAAREERIFAEIARGNVPDWLRRLERVEVIGEVDGDERIVTLWVAPDYLAVGSDEDYFLVPLSPRTGQRIADLVGASLPTRRMVDLIWASARVRLAPIRIEFDEHMMSFRYAERHDRLVRAQRFSRGVPVGAFAAGHKADIVLTTSLRASPDEAGIYGWHRGDGVPIQPLFHLHEESGIAFHYGIRLVSRRALVDGIEVDLHDVLRDPGLAPLLNDDGAFTGAP
jgi:hypothetical protein